MKSYTPPPDKSITIRALLTAAVAEGTTRIENPLFSADTEAALSCIEALGVRHCTDGNAIIVEGRGLKGLKQPSGPLDAGESAALARMLAGLLAGQSFASVITGRGSLLKRPMTPTADALNRLGAKVTADRGCLPLRIKPAKLKGGKIPGVSSAQVKSASLFAGLYSAKPVEILEKLPARDHTERLLALAGAHITKDGTKIRIEPGALTARPLRVPGDISSAAPIIAAALLAGKPLRITGCGLNPTRLGFVDTLGKMCARISVRPEVSFPEPSGEIGISPSKMKAVTLKPANIPSLLDEVPLLAVLAAAAKGVTSISGIEGLRAKESDRVESTLALLAALGAKASYGKGVFTVKGPVKFSCRTAIKTFGDHRIAMAAGAASAACRGLKTDDPACVDKSYPGFWGDLRAFLKH